jgi:crossover junction endodeoxyribonuclease RuvC
MAKILGLDISLTATGVVIIEDDTLIFSDTIKTKPGGKKPSDEVKRLQKILDSINKIIDEHSPELVVIEGLAFMAKNTTALVQLAGLNYMIRCELVDRKLKFLIVAPTTLKRFITGKGNAQKDHMMLEVYKQYGHALTDNNVCDAFALSRVGLAMVDPSHRETVTHREVVNLISSQLT